MSDIFTSFGFNVVSSLELQIATKSEKEKKYNHEQIMKAFDTFITRIQKGQRNAITMGQMVRFNLFKLISGYNKERFKEDYQYYKDKTNIPYDGKINLFKKKFAKLQAMKMLKDFMKNR